MKQIKTTMKIAVIAMMGMSLGVESQVEYDYSVNIKDKGTNADLRYKLNSKVAVASYNTRNSQNDILYLNKDWSSDKGWHNDFEKISMFGNVGIGTTSPEAPLQIHSNEYSISEGIRLHDPNSGASEGLWIQFSQANMNDMGRVGARSLNTKEDSLNFYTKGANDSKSIERMRISSNGNTALYGKFEVKEIKVTTSPTADFVFEEDYNLPILKSIEKHIREKKHLPEIASAKEMEKNGVNVGDFQIQLLQKIEELTLYTIDQQKEIKELKKQNSEIKELKALVEKLLKDKN